MSTLNPLDPGDAEIRHAWAEWKRAIAYGYPTAAQEWREMYLALLGRRDKTVTAHPGAFPAGSGNEED